MMQDRVKTRLIIPLITIFIIFIYVSSIFQSNNTSEPGPTKINFRIKPTKFVEIGTPMRLFILLVMDQYDKPYKGTRVKLKVHDLILLNNFEKIDCNFKTLMQNFWNYQYLRNIGPCSIEFSGSEVISDESGYASFYNATFTKAPQGSYYIYFETDPGLLVTSIQNILVAPLIYSMKVENNPPLTFNVGKALSTQPLVIVYDKYGIPISNMMIDIISWPFGDHQMNPPQLFDPEVNKFAVLSGNKSPPSDFQGIIEFQNLTILGSTHSNVYLIIVSNGLQVFASWKKSVYPSNIPRIITIPVFIPPIQIQYEYNVSINTIQNLPLNAIEGISFDLQPSFSIHEAISKRPISGILCFCLFKKFNGLNFVNGYQPNYYGAHKKSIIKGITGIYNENNQSLFNNDFVAYPSEYSGYIEFKGLAISKEGSNYNKTNEVGISFVCGNKETEIKYLNLETIAKYVYVLNFPIFKYGNDANSDDLSNKGDFSILIEDSNYNPLSNKIVNKIELVSFDGNLTNNPILKTYENDFHPSKTYNLNSDENGIINSYAQIYQSNETSGIYCFRVYIDEISNICNHNISILFYTIPLFCPTLIIDTSFKNEYTIQDLITFEINLSQQNYFGDYCDFNINENNTFEITSPSNIFSEIDNGPINYVFNNYIKFLTHDNTSLNSSVISLSFDISNFFSGSYYFFGFFQYRLESEEYLISNFYHPIIIHYINRVNKVKLIYPFETQIKELTLGDNLKENISVLILDKNDDPLSTCKINSSIVIYEYPHYLEFLRRPGLFSSNFNNFSVLIETAAFKLSIQNENCTTDDDGKVNVSIEMNQLYKGRYVISILINGISTEPFIINYNLENYKITLVQFPLNNSEFHLLEKLPSLIQIKVEGKTNTNLSYIPIVAYFHSLDLESCIDLVSSDQSEIVLNQNRLNLTNSSGFASFTNLRILSFDNSSNNKNCVKGYFYFAFPSNKSIRSSSTPIYTFCANNFLIIPNGNHDTNFPFFFNLHEAEISISFIENKSINIFNSDHPLLFNLRMIKFDSKNIDVNTSNILSNSLLINYRCITYLKNVVNEQTCSISPNSANTKQHIQIYSIKFCRMNFQYFDSSQKFDFAACLFNLCNYTSKSLASFGISTNTIYVKLLSIFPDIITIGDKLIGSFGLFPFMPYITYHCNIISQSQNIINKSNINQISNLMALQSDNVDFLNSLSYNSTRIQLNYSKVFSISDLNGIINMQFEFLSGKSGYYMIMCDSDSDAGAIKSNIFYFYNPIYYFHILNTMTNYNIFIKADSYRNALNIIGCSINSSMFLSIKDSSNNSIKNLEDFIHVEYMAKLNKESEDFSTKSTLDNLIDILTVFTSGPSNLQKITENLIFNYSIRSIQFEKISMNYIINDLNIELPTTGLYNFKFECNGMLSEEYFTVNISEYNYQNFIEFIFYYSNYLYIISATILIISNSLYFSFFLLLVSGILMIINFLVYIISNSMNIFSLILGGLILLAIIILIVIQIIYLYIQNDFSYFFNIRKEIIIKYSMRKIYFCLLRKRQCNNMNKLTNYKFNNILSQSMKRESFHMILQNEIKDTNVKMIKGDGLIYRIVTPFILIMNSFKCFDSLNCFYYPQRFLLAVFASILTLIYCIFQVTNYLFSIINTVTFFQSQITTQIFTYINELFTNFQNKLNHSMKIDELGYLFYIIDQCNLMLNHMQSTIKIALILANVFVSIVFIFALTTLIIKFRKLVLKSRKSLRIIQKYLKPHVSSASEFTGLMMGNTALSYIIITSLLAIIISLLINKYFWALIWEYRTFLFFLLIPNLFQVIVGRILVDLVFADRQLIALPNLLQIYDLYCLIISIFEGIVSTFTRVIYGLLSFFVGLIRFDKSIIPKWLNSSFLSDDVDESFDALLSVHMHYSNPIMLYFGEEILKKRLLCPRNSIKRMWVTHILKKYPEIFILRKKVRINCSSGTADL